ncbi:MAG: dihydroorotate dehydrogenase electron transfer subunit [Candidatus Thorarchaeota archaeon]|nr:dihydroorotate dehydrogenase electron transfer subunit [Candidatus Thorarchaeota archaeon]
MNMDELMGNPGSVQISKVITENPRSKTLQFSLKNPIEFQPGQFVMVWVPDVDEIPMSISSWNPPEMGITVQTIGEATQALASMSKGDWIGIRGPFGNPFSTNSKKALVVGGGVGIAPLRPLVYNLLDAGSEVTLVNAAKTKNELIYRNEFEKLKHPNLKVAIATDDGSLGFKGFATDAVSNLLDGNEFDSMYTCGPELLMAGLYDLTKKRKIGFQASLERFMTCGCGICGTCAMDPTGHLVCVDGPVFTGEQLAGFTDFGKYHRDAVGMKNEC